jgi:hypothetical protein
VIPEADRAKFLRRIMVMFMAAVVGVSIAVVVLALSFVGANVSTSVRRELRAHEMEEKAARDTLRAFVREEHEVTRREVARFRKRIAQLEDFIIKQGLEPPRNGFVSGVPLASPSDQALAEKEKPAPGTPPNTPGAAPNPTPNPEPSPSVSPGPTPSPTPSPFCIDLPPPAPPAEELCFPP